MEPMTLGSAPSSPNTSPIVTNPNYLPAFLMGESQPLTPRATAISPAKSRNVSFKANAFGSEKNVTNQRLYPQLQDPQQQTASPFNLSVNEKAGPPARGLFDTLDGAEQNSWTTQTSRSPCPDRSTNFTSPQQSNLSRSFRRQRQYQPDADSLWVTVLGFPPNAANLVLAQFAQCGTITDKKFPAEGNWVHLKYSSRFEVSKALSFNGKLIASSIMVGVVSYNEHENKENQSGLNESLTLTSPNRARPLTRPYVVPQNANTAVLSSPNVPQKSSGLVSKAMEYVFGW